MKHSKQAVLIIAPVMDYLTEKLEQTFTVHKLYQVTDHAEFLADQGKNIKGIVTRGDIGVTNESWRYCLKCRSSQYLVSGLMPLIWIIPVSAILS